MDEKAIDDAYDNPNPITLAPPGSSAKFFVGEDFNGPAKIVLTGLAADTFKGLLLQQSWGKVHKACASLDELEVAAEIENKDYPGQQFAVFIRNSRGQTLAMPIQPYLTVSTLKNTICRKLNIPFYSHVLMYEDETLDDRRLFCEYQIPYAATLYLEPQLNGFKIPSLGECVLDPGFHFDFTNEADVGKEYHRGGRLYNRPVGWFRYALKVRGRYENDTWLFGTQKRTTPYESAPGEWPVSYHGTSFHNGKGIAEEGYLLSKGVRFAYGKGIYSTPDIVVAEQYAQRMEHEGVTYIVIIQNRVNPNTVKEVATKYWLVPNEKDIRPYGFCLKRVDR